MEAIEFICPTCGNGVQAAVVHAGHAIQCPHCSNMVTVPSAPHSKKAQWPWFLIIPAGVGVALFFLSLADFSSNGRADERDALKEETSVVLPNRVEEFFLKNYQFGKPLEAQWVVGWRNGQRLWVETDTGRSLLLYLKDGEVVTVYQDYPDKGRVKMWGTYESNPSN